MEKLTHECFVEFTHERASRLMHVPAEHGIDQRDAERVHAIARILKKG